MLADSKELERLHAGQADDDLYELAQYIKTNGKSEITEKHISSRALGIQPFSTATENAFLENLTHALENIWLSQSKYVIHKEVAISQVFQDNMTYDDLFYMGRFDFVVYEKQGKRNCRFWQSNLTGKSILKMRWCRSVTGRKMPSVRHTIWRLYGWKILMPEGIIILREF